MIVHYQQMTGDELKLIYKGSGMKSADFAKRLGLEQHQLYTQFSRQAKPIDKEIADRVAADSDLANQKLFVVSKQKNLPGEDDRGGSVVHLLSETLQVLKEVIKKNEKKDNQITTLIATVTDSNKHIREEAALSRKMISGAYDQGLLRWVKGKT